MNRRQRKKHTIAPELLCLARSVSVGDWENYSTTEKKIILMVCQRAVAENFPLDDYFLWEIPLRGTDYWVLCFIGKEFNPYKPSETHYRQIDFWVKKAKNNKRKYSVAPASLECEKKKCLEAVYYD